MHYKKITVSLLFFFFLTGSNTFSQIYPDQHYVLKIDSIYQNIESNDGLRLSDDGKSIILQDAVTNGYVILKPQTSYSPFNQGLPSWNGTSPDNNSSFKIQMRFTYGSSWSPWLTVGYWKSNIWTSYGITSYGGGYVDIDYIKLNSYQSTWQFKIIMTRNTVSDPSPSLNKLSFFVSDSRTTTSLDFNQILNDNPAQIFIPTEFIYQYGVDPQIGGDICSPTSVSMILRSYNIAVDPLQFALDTHDPYWDMFGIWPRVVENASEYGLDGAVTRYRTWSETREVLAAGGRIAMSVGLPLYTGHLMMLAGFTADGRPIVHDPAKSNGYSFVYNKSDISHSWFDKGGIAYTFYLADSVAVSVEDEINNKIAVDNFNLSQNYPNPFNPSTTINFQIQNRNHVSLKVYDLLGNEIASLVDEEIEPGNYNILFNADNLPSGLYIYTLRAGSFIDSKKMLLVK